MRSEHDPLASHIFTSRRGYRNVLDIKSGKRSERAARASWLTVVRAWVSGELGEWERLMGAVASGETT
jgi:hypothetical protein